MGNWGTSSRDFQLFFLLLYFAAIQTMAAISYFKYLQDSVYHRYENQPTFHFIDKMRRVSSFFETRDKQYVFRAILCAWRVISTSFCAPSRAKSWQRHCTIVAHLDGSMVHPFLQGSPVFSTYRHRYTDRWHHATCDTCRKWPHLFTACTRYGQIRVAERWVHRVMRRSRKKLISRQRNKPASNEIRRKSCGLRVEEVRAVQPVCRYAGRSLCRCAVCRVPWCGFHPHRRRFDNGAERNRCNRRRRRRRRDEGRRRVRRYEQPRRQEDVDSNVACEQVGSNVQLFLGSRDQDSAGTNVDQLGYVIHPSIDRSLNKPIFCRKLPLFICRIFPVILTLYRSSFVLSRPWISWKVIWVLTQKSIVVRL